MNRRTFLGLAAALGLPGCKSETAPASSGKLVVFAAASLRDAFTGIAEDFEKERAGTEIAFNFAGTQELRTQVEQGAAADVFASADTSHMDKLVAAGLVKDPSIFARNEPVLVVAKDKAKAITSLAQLPDAERIVVGVPEVPIGRYTLEILDRASTELGGDFRARVEKKIVSRELNVRQVLAKVTLGEADAGFVYRSDVAVAKDPPVIVALPASANVIARYPIAMVSASASPDLARAFIDRVRSEAGQATLLKHGFLAAAAS